MGEGYAKSCMIEANAAKVTYKKWLQAIRLKILNHLITEIADVVIDYLKYDWPEPGDDVMAMNQYGDWHEAQVIARRQDAVYVRYINFHPAASEWMLRRDHPSENYDGDLIVESIRCVTCMRQTGPRSPRGFCQECRAKKLFDPPGWDFYPEQSQATTWEAEVDDIEFDEMMMRCHPMNEVRYYWWNKAWPDDNDRSKIPGLPTCVWNRIRHHEHYVLLKGPEERLY